MTTADEVIKYLEGAVIESGGVTEDGVHFLLKDGRVLVFMGDFVMGFDMLDKRTLN